MASWVRSLGDHIFCFLFHRKFCIVFSISFLISFGIVYIGTMYQSLDKRIWFKILSFHLKQSYTLLQILIFDIEYWFQIIDQLFFVKVTISLSEKSCFISSNESPLKFMKKSFRKGCWNSSSNTFCVWFIKENASHVTFY